MDDPRDEGRIQGPHEERVVVVGDERTVLHHPPAAEHLPDRLQALCRFANDGSELPAVIRAILVHYQLAYEHPFVDGNGRTARALFYWMMLEQGYALFEYLTISRAFHRSKKRYGMAFVHSEQSADVSYFVRHHLDVVLATLDALGAYLDKRRRDRIEAEQAAMGLPGLNLSQRLVLKASMDDPSLAHSARAYSSEFQVTHTTALKHLKELEARRLLRRERRGRTMVFLAVADLKKRLRVD